MDSVIFGSKLSMSYFDIVLLVPLLWGLYKGFRKGLIIEIASLAALALGILGAVHFSHYTGSYLADYLDLSQKAMKLVAFGLTFILIVIATFAVARLVERLAKMVALGLVNRVLGALFGMMKFLLITGVLIHLTNQLDAKYHFLGPELAKESLLYDPMSKIIPTIYPLLDEAGVPDII